MLLGQTLMPCINALLLGSLMYRSRLVPRIIPVIGLIGAPLLISAVIATLFRGIGHVAAWSAIATIPVAAWELSLGVWLVVKGFRPSPITAAMDAASTSARRARRRRLPSKRQHGRALPQGPAVSALAACCVPMAVLRRCGAHRTRRTGRIATALVIAHSPATVYSTP